MKNLSSQNKKLLAKCKKIKLVLTDVDGVLTDGGMYYSEKGEVLKKFYSRDGMAVELLLKHGIKTVFITKEDTSIVKKRSRKVKAVSIYMNILKKEKELPKISKEFRVNANEIAYIGDDINDLEIMKRVGLSAAPSDSIKKVRKMVDYVCISKGGEGAFREVADIILSFKSLRKN